MNKEELLEQYHQKGGTYVIPVEVMNDFIEDYKESEQKRLKAIKYINDYQKFYRENYTTDLDEWQMEEKVKEILEEDNE